MTASGGDISNFPITDKLPAELNYVSSAVT